MADLHISEVDEDVLARLRERAEAEGRPLEALVREVLGQMAASHPSRSDEQIAFADAIERIRAMPPEDRVPDVEPVEIEGIPASELLIRDRRRR